MITEMGRDLQNLDDDILDAKRIIKEKICRDLDIIKYLNNKSLQTSNADADDYFGINIFPFIYIPGTQDVIKNFICFAVDDMEDSRYNEAMKVQYLQFVIFCHSDDIDTGFGISRHDLLAYFIRDIFNWSVILGLQLKLVSNRESVTDTSYLCRTLKFESIKPNMTNRGMNPIPRKYDSENSHGLITH